MFFCLHWISIEYLYTVWVNTHYKCTLEMCILTYKIQFNDCSVALEIMLLTSSITLSLFFNNGVQLMSQPV